MYKELLKETQRVAEDGTFLSSPSPEGTQVAMPKIEKEKPLMAPQSPIAVPTGN